MRSSSTGVERQPGTFTQHPKRSNGDACAVPWGPDSEQQQAEVYAALLGACLDNVACESFETWGFTDLHTWRPARLIIPRRASRGSPT